MPKKHILIADDDRAVVRFAERVFELAQHRVSAVDNGEEALEKIKAWHGTGQQVDLLIADIRMPGMTGLELLTKVEEEKLPLPVILTTGYVDPETLVQVMSLGCFDYLEKPLALQTLVATVGRALEVPPNRLEGRLGKTDQEAAKKTHKDVGTIELDAYASDKIAQLLEVPVEIARQFLLSGRVSLTRNPHTQGWTVDGESIQRLREARQRDENRLAPYLVLAVDDEPSVLRVIRSALEGASTPFEIITCSDGYEALIKLAVATPDLVILDIRMPDVDGKAILKAMAKSERTRWMKKLVISGYVHELDEMLVLGADDVLAKPFKLSELTNKVTKLLGDWDGVPKH